MPAIFNRSVSEYKGAFSADSATLTFSSGGTALPAGMLTQQLQLTYAQAITRVYEVGQPHMYYIGGRTQGTASIGRIIAPGLLLAAFYDTFGDICRAAGNTISFSMRAKCSEVPGNLPSDQIGTYIAKACVITQVGFAVAAQDMVVNESSQLMFSALEYQDPGA